MAKLIPYGMGYVNIANSDFLSRRVCSIECCQVENLYANKNYDKPLRAYIRVDALSIEHCDG